MRNGILLNETTIRDEMNSIRNALRIKTYIFKEKRKLERILVDRIERVLDSYDDVNATPVQRATYELEAYQTAYGVGMLQGILDINTQRVEPI